MTIESPAAQFISGRTAGSRRTLLLGLLGAPLAPLWLTAAIDNAEAKKRHRKRRRRHKDTAASPTPPASPPPPDPVVRADASCSGPETLFAAPNGNNRVAQTFTPSASGLLVRAQFTLDNPSGSNGDYVLTVNQVDGSGTPTNAVLAQAAVTNLTVPDGVSTLDFTFASPASVGAGTQLALVLTRPGGDRFAVQSRGGGCDGQAFFSPDQTAPFTLGDNDADLIFTTFVRS